MIRCERCKQKMEHMNVDYRYDREGEVKKFVVCDECTLLSDSEFFTVMYEDEIKDINSMPINNWKIEK